MYDKTIKLSNGIDVPVLALGTWLIDDDFVSDAVRQAVKIGYRHIDTAQAYGNERGVGEGIRTCGVERSKMFVASKVAAELFCKVCWKKELKFLDKMFIILKT